MVKIVNIIRLCGFCVLLYCLLILGLYSFEHHILFQPTTLAEDHVFQFDHPFEEFFLEKEGTSRINALYFKTEKPSKGAILYFHGNRDNLQRWGQYHKDFTSRAFDVLFIDYQGYGKSRGEATEAALYQNAEMAYDWLKEKYDRQDIILYGRSMGTAPAAYLASKVPARFLILETPFNNIRSVLQYNLPFQYLPFEPENRLPNDEYLKQLSYPVYIFQGTQDWVVPYQTASQLIPLLKPQDRFYTIEGGSHGDLSSFESYHQWLDELLN